MCLPLFCRSDLGEYLKMNVEDTQKSHYTLSYLEFPLCSPRAFVLEFEQEKSENKACMLSDITYNHKPNSIYEYRIVFLRIPLVG